MTDGADRSYKTYGTKKRPELNKSFWNKELIGHIGHISPIYPIKPSGGQQ